MQNEWKRQVVESKVWLWT